MRGDVSDYKVGDEVIVVVTAIKSREGKIDFEPAHVESYNIKKLTKSIPRTLISQLDEKKSKFVRIDGEVQQIQQTSGPTIFIISDESGTTEIAAFDKAGERSYPEIEVADAVQVIGEVNEHSGKTQIESSSMIKLDEENTKQLHKLIDDALNERANS